MPLRIAGRSDLATCPAREDQTSVSHFLPGWAKRGDWHQPSWGYGTKQEQHGDPAPHRRLDPTAFQSARRKRGPWYWCGLGVPPLPVASALAGPLERAARTCRSQCTCVIDEKAPAESLTDTTELKPYLEEPESALTCPGPGTDSPSKEAVVLYLIYKRDPKIIIINYPGAGE